MDTIGETFYPLIQHRLTFSKSPTNRTWTFSIGIASCPMDPMDTIGTTFYPVIQHRLTFSKSLTNRTWTFPSESVRVRWITSISRPLHCSGNTTYLFTASQLYTALRFHGFRHALFYNSCKETRRNNARVT